MSELKEFIDNYFQGNPVDVALRILKPENRLTLDYFINHTDLLDKKLELDTYSIRDKLKFAIHLQTLGKITNNFGLFDKSTIYIKNKLAILNKQSHKKSIVPPQYLIQYYINEIYWNVKVGNYPQAFTKLKICLDKWHKNNTHTQAIEVHLAGLFLFNNYHTDCKPHLDNKATIKKFMDTPIDSGDFESVYWRVEYLKSEAEYYLNSNQLKRVSDMGKVFQLQKGLDILEEARVLANLHQNFYDQLDYNVVEMLSLKIEHFETVLELYKTVESVRRCLHKMR